MPFATALSLSPLLGSYVTRYYILAVLNLLPLTNVKRPLARFVFQILRTLALLFDIQSSEKTYKISQHVACNVAGLTADANILIDQARLRAGRYEYQYCEPIPVEQLVELVCNYKQAYTQYGGLRPFGVAFLFAGYDEHYGFQLYQSDPSGNYSGWKATVIGSNNQAGKSLLKNEYGSSSSEEEEEKEGEMKVEGAATEEISMPDVKGALRLAVKVLNKTMDASASSSEKMELYVMSLENGQVVHKILNKEEAQKVIDEVEAEATPAGET